MYVCMNMFRAPPAILIRTTRGTLYETLWSKSEYCTAQLRTFAESAMASAPEVQQVLAGQAEFALQRPLLALQGGHACLQVLDGVFHVPLPEPLGAATRLLQPHQPGGHPDGQRQDNRLASCNRSGVSMLRACMSACVRVHVCMCVHVCACVCL